MSTLLTSAAVGELTSGKLAGNTLTASGSVTVRGETLPVTSLDFKKMVAAKMANDLSMHAVLHRA